MTVLIIIVLIGAFVLPYVLKAWKAQRRSRKVLRDVRRRLDRER